MFSKDSKSSITDNGYASHPDNLKRHEKVDQAQWIGASEAVINDLVKHMLPSTTEKAAKNFFELYALAASERHRVAVELKQGQFESKDRVADYGTPRPEYGSAQETILKKDIPQAWAGMRIKLFEMFEQLKVNAKPLENDFDLKTERAFFNSKKPEILGGDRYAYESRLLKDKKHNKPYYLHTITIRAPWHEGGSHTQQLSKIKVVEYLNPNDAISGDPPEVMAIEYADINKYRQQRDFEIADTYFQAMLKATGTQQEKMDLFMENAGKLAFLLAHILPVKLGNAGITEWIIRAAAFKVGLQLGPFNRSEGISWDFKALFTPDSKVFIKWFKEKAFVGIEATAGSTFSFGKTNLSKSLGSASLTIVVLNKHEFPERDFFCDKKFVPVEKNELDFKKSM